MANLSVNNIAAAGTAVALGAASGGGDTFAGTGKEVLVVENGDGSPHTVTLATFKSVNGLTVPNRAVTVAAGATKYIPVGKEHVDPADGNVDITYDGVTSVAVGVIRLTDS